MSITTNVTAIIPQLMNAVIFMDNSPAKEAFCNELSDIIEQLKTEKLYKSMAESIDTAELISHYSTFILNCQQAYLLWNITEEREASGKKGAQSYISGETEYGMFLKVFAKTYGKLVESLCGGNEISFSGVQAVEDKLIAAIEQSEDVYTSFRDFFRGYVYGCVFNFLEEQANMRLYAEYLICVGVMGNVISTSEAQKQSLFNRMGELLSQNRFKYITGMLPVDVVAEYVFDRYITDTFETDEAALYRLYIKSVLINNFTFNRDDNTIEASASHRAFTIINSRFTSVKQLSRSIYVDLFDYNKFVLSGSIHDSGELTASKFGKFMAAKCQLNCVAEEESAGGKALQISASSFRIPAVIVSDKDYYINDGYSIMLMNCCDKEYYVKAEANDLPIKVFPFIRDELKMNYFYYRVRELQLSVLEKNDVVKPSVTRYCSVRYDKTELLDQIKAVDNAENATEDDKKMMKLELTLQLVSGNMEADKYDEFLDANVLNTRMYENYVKYRMKKLCEAGKTTREGRIQLISELNRIESKLK